MIIGVKNSIDLNFVYTATLTLENANGKMVILIFCKDSKSVSTKICEKNHKVDNVKLVKNVNSKLNCERLEIYKKKSF